MFKREMANIIDTVPAGCVWVRHWDLAATKEKILGRGARTAGVLIGRAPNKRFVIANCTTMMKDDPRPDVKLVAQTDDLTYGRVHVSIPRDPGAGGKMSAQDYVLHLAGHDVAAQAESGDKVSRAEPVAAQWNAGNVDLVRGTWIPEFLDEISKFPTGSRKDIVDSMSGGFGYLLMRPEGEFFTMGTRGTG